MKVEGLVDPRFASVRDVFEENFDERGEVGAALCVYLDGRPVVDIWAGVVEYGTDRPWNENTTCVMDSATKAITAMCALMLVDDGRLDLDAPVASYWPEFASENKADLPVRYLLTHQAGLPAVDTWITIDHCEAWTPIIAALEAQRLYWEPGTAHGYHGLTFGWLVGEVIRRITGLTPGAFVSERIAPSLGLDLWIGLPADQEHRVASVARVDFKGDAGLSSTGDATYDEFTRSLTDLYTNPRFVEAYADPSKRTPDLFDEFKTIGQRAFGPIELGMDMNGRRYHALEVPAATGIATARSLARLYSSLIGEVHGVRLVSPSVLDQARHCYTSGPDQVVLVDTAWGLGFMVPGGQMFAPPSHTAFGHAGANGALGFADPERDIAVGYLRNNMIWAIPDPRSAPLVATIYECL